MIITRSAQPASMLIFRTIQPPRLRRLFLYQVLCPPENYENLEFFREPMWEVPACQLDMRCRTSLSRKNPRNGVYVYLFLSKQRRHAVKLLWRICTSFGLYLLWSGTRFLPQAARARTHPLEMKSTLRLDSQQRAPADASSYGYRTECLEGRGPPEFPSKTRSNSARKICDCSDCRFFVGVFPRPRPRPYEKGADGL
ncbi:hypothetical protein C8R46DRAFT_135035 [Mycena filopes]|nr:hypothetical protein C8R46DRAFT_135035 [Mycena filopes]